MRGEQQFLQTRAHEQGTSRCVGDVVRVEIVYVFFVETRLLKIMLEFCSIFKEPFMIFFQTFLNVFQIG